MPGDTTPSNLTECQLLIDPPADGAWNMAVDEVLLDEVASTGQPVLRFYQWQQPTLSLGYFQAIADRTQHPASASADVVRRLSGGGAILHDRELTYSFLLPATHELSRDTQRLYDSVHQVIVKQLSTQLPDSAEWQPTLCDTPSVLSRREEPFLCFQRRAQGDILLQRSAGQSPTADHKIVGSAQRRRRGTVLQHGSILLSRSALATELPGFNDLTDQHLAADDLIRCLPSQLANVTQLRLVEGKLTDALITKVRQLQQAKYQSASWTDRR